MPEAPSQASPSAPRMVTLLGANRENAPIVCLPTISQTRTSKPSRAHQTTNHKLSLLPQVVKKLPAGVWAGHRCAVASQGLGWLIVGSGTNVVLRVGIRIAVSIHLVGVHKEELCLTHEHLEAFAMCQSPGRGSLGLTCAIIPTHLCIYI